jgi:hypothetical protein
MVDPGARRPHGCDRLELLRTAQGAMVVDDDDDMPAWLMRYSRASGPNRATAAARALSERRRRRRVSGRCGRMTPRSLAHARRGAFDRRFAAIWMCEGYCGAVRLQWAAAAVGGGGRQALAMLGAPGPPWAVVQFW